MILQFFSAFFDVFPKKYIFVAAPAAAMSIKASVNPGKRLITLLARVKSRLTGIQDWPVFSFTQISVSDRSADPPGAPPRSDERSAKKTAVVTRKIKRTPIPFPLLTVNDYGVS